MPDFPTTPVDGDTHVIATSTWEYYSSTDRWEIQDTSGGGGGGGGGGGSNAWHDITGTPTTISGYGITDAVTSSSATVFTNKSGAISQWTNDAGYITAAGITSRVVSDITPQLGGDLDGQHHTITNVTIGNSTEFHGNILLTGTATSTEASRTIDFTGFDKEGTTDFTDRAYIRHTVGVGGHANTVLEISSLNDAADGIAFTTHANSLLRHNGNAIYSEGHKPEFSEITSTPTTIAGYGITDAFNGAYGSLSGTPTTISGYGITDAFDGAYGSLSGTPTTLAGYGITDGGGATTLTDLGIADGTNGQVLTTNGSAGFTFTTVASGGGGSTAWGDITGTPTTITGYGITDAFDGAYGSLSGTPTTIGGYGIADAFNGVFGSLTGIPTTIAGYGITDAFDGSYMSLTSVPSIPNVLTDLAISDGTNGQVLTTDGSGGFTFTTVGATGAGDVGTYIFAGRNTYGNIVQNLTYSGSTLISSGFASTNQYNDNTAATILGSALSGTWRAMGDVNITSRRASTLFLRIS